MYLFLENHWAEWLQLWTTYSLKCFTVLDKANFWYLPRFFYYIAMCVEKLERFRAHFGRLAKMLPRQYKERYQKSAPSVFKWEYELPVYQISSISPAVFSKKVHKKGGLRLPLICFVNVMVYEDKCADLKGHGRSVVFLIGKSIQMNGTHKPLGKWYFIVRCSKFYWITFF